MNLLPFSDDNLAAALSNRLSTAHVIKRKLHFKYLSGYLSVGLKARTIVVEDPYISKDFLHDYNSYYSLCYADYGKFCKRIHFFNADYTSEEIDSLVLSTGAEDIKRLTDTYLGFIVVKPIPHTLIGYTVLKTYSDNIEVNQRDFWGIRTYTVHFFGTELKLSSLAFQEQDSVLAACATTAIWSMLNKAAVDFHTILKSPSEITKDADKVSYDGSRLFPNKGLNILQICQSIQNSGLVSEIKQPDFTTEVDGNECMVVSNVYVKKILNAYSRIGIPILLIIAVPNRERYGQHAITVSGYKTGEPNYDDVGDLALRSQAIEKFYAHDDQWGPFVRITFNGQDSITTPWTDNDPSKRPTYVTSVIVPVYPKIRISFEDIEVIALGLDGIFGHFFVHTSRLNWDICIDYSENYKKSIKDSSLAEAKKIVRLKKAQPKYLWIISAFVGEEKMLQFAFDATDVRSGMICRDAVSYLPDEINTILYQYLENNADAYQDILHHSSGKEYYDYILKELRE